MTDARVTDTTSPMPSAETRPDATSVAKSNASQARAKAKATAGASHPPATATFNELLAKEALASLKRARTTARTDAVQTKARVLVPPATIVVRPPKSHAWMTPFVSLAVIVGVSTFLSVGGIAYLSLRPFAASYTSDVELRAIRESVAQLRRNVADLSSQVATNRTALDAANKAASDQLARSAQSPDSVRREPSASVEKIDRTANNKTQSARPPAAELATDITGSVQQPKQATTARPVVIADWQVRRAYEGVAVLAGKNGVIEVAPGQEVPDVGRILEIKLDGGRWQVLTSMGVILSAR